MSEEVNKEETMPTKQESSPVLTDEQLDEVAGGASPPVTTEEEKTRESTLGHNTIGNLTVQSYITPSDRREP